MATEAAEERSKKLLYSLLTRGQQLEFEKQNYVELPAHKSGRVVRFFRNSCVCECSDNSQGTFMTSRNYCIFASEVEYTMTIPSYDILLANLLAYRFRHKTFLKHAAT